MPIVLESMQPLILAYRVNEKLDFEAFGTSYIQSEIVSISDDGTVEVIHSDGSPDAYSVHDMTLKLEPSPEFKAHFNASIKRQNSLDTTILEKPMVVFTVPLVHHEVQSDAQGKLFAVQSGGQFVGAVPSNGNPFPGGGVYHIPATYPVSSGAAPNPPAYYAVPQNPPTESVNSGIAIFPSLPGQPIWPYYPASAGYPANIPPNYIISQPHPVINNAPGGNITVNNYYRIKEITKNTGMISLLK